MNPREKNLLVILGAIVGCCAALFVGVQWFWKPLQAYNKTIADLRDENEKRADELQTFFKQRKKLEIARLKSLPTNAGTAASEYSRYLQAVLIDSGVDVDVITPSTQATKVKPSPLVPSIKDVGHLTMTFAVKARGELPQFIKAMERLQTTPYEHRIKELSLNRLDSRFGKDASSKLSILFTVETLLVARTPAKQGLPPGIDPRLVLTESLASMNAFTARPSGLGMIAAALLLKQETPMPVDRHYADIGRKNIFVGGFPPTPKGKELDSGEKPAPPETTPNENVPLFVRLNMCVPNQETAYLRNLIYKAPEIKLIAKPRSGYEFFRITEGDYVFFQAKVLRVDPREVYFQVKDQVYELHIGQSLDEAMRFPLSFDRKDALDLFDVFDRDWAKQQMEKDKAAVANTKKKGTKGR